MIRFLLRIFKAFAPSRPAEDFVVYEPLTGLAQEAAMLAAAFEGMDPYAVHPGGDDDDALEGRMNADELDRWRRDADDWARRAMEAETEDPRPYRGDTQVDRRLQDAGAAVGRAVQDGLLEDAAQHLSRYVADVRAGLVPPPPSGAKHNQP